MTDGTNSPRKPPRPSRRPVWAHWTWAARSRLDQVGARRVVTVVERAQALDHAVVQALRPVTLPVLRVLFGLLFVWFGALKVTGRSPVAGLIAQTLPFGNDHLVLLILGIAELALGVLLISGVFVRVALAALAMHLAGTFSAFAMAPGMMFSEDNPLLLTADGEFVAKNGVLIAATLVLIAHTNRTANSSRSIKEEPTERLATPAIPDTVSQQPGSWSE